MQVTLSSTRESTLHWSKPQSHYPAADENHLLRFKILLLNIEAAFAFCSPVCHLSAMVKAEDQEGKPVWDKPVDVDEKWIQFVDDNVSASEPFVTEMA